MTACDLKACESDLISQRLIRQVPGARAQSGLWGAVETFPVVDSAEEDKDLKADDDSVCAAVTSLHKLLGNMNRWANGT